MSTGLEMTESVLMMGEGRVSVFQTLSQLIVLFLPGKAQYILLHFMFPAKSHHSACRVLLSLKWQGSSHPSLIV